MVKNIHKGVRLPESMIEEIESYSAQNGLCFSESVRQIIAASLAKENTINDARSLKYNVTSWYMLQEIIIRIFGDEAKSVLSNITEKATEHIEKYSK